MKPPRKISDREIVIRLLTSMHEVDYFRDGLVNALDGAEIPLSTQPLNDLIFLLVFGREDLENGWEEKWYAYWSDQRGGDREHFNAVPVYEFLEKLREERADWLSRMNDPNDLFRFCDPERCPQPFKHDGFEYASDGRIAVRRECEDQVSKPACEAAARKIDELLLPFLMQELPPALILPEGVDQSGYSIQLGSKKISCQLLARIADLPNIRVYDIGSPLDPFFFVWSGGVGVLMPMKTVREVSEESE